MPTIRMWRRSVIGAVAIGVCAGGTGTAQAILPPSLELRVPKPPTIGTAESGSFLAYELHVTNFSAQPLTLRGVEVLGENGVIFTLVDAAVSRAQGA